MDKSHLKLQFERLRRHYLIAKEEKDKIAFLDLSHALRIWAESKRDVDRLVSMENYTLNLPSKVNNKNLKKILKGSSFFDVPLASVSTDFTPGLQIKGLQIVDRALSPEEIKKIFEMGLPKEQASGATFSEWLGSEIISTSDPKDKSYVGISRDIIIKRVANLLGASHPEGVDDGNEKENKFDPFIIGLSKIEVASGYPLTHYQLIEIAQTIMKALEDFFVDKKEKR